MNRTTPAPGKRDHWSTYDPTTLHRILVEDAVQNHATDLPWMVGAIARMAEVTKRPAEELFQAVVMEVESLGARMPIASGPM